MAELDDMIGVEDDEDEEEKRPKPQPTAPDTASRPPAPEVASPLMASPVGAPAMASTSTAPPAPALPEGVGAGQPAPPADPYGEYKRLAASKPGVAGVHGLPGVLAKIGDVAGSAFLPGVSAFIPGTTMHHQLLTNQALHAGQHETAIDKAAEDEMRAEQGATDTSAVRQATAAHLGAETAAIPGTTAAEESLKQAQVQNLLNPQAKTDFEAWQKQNAGKPISDWLQLKATEAAAGRTKNEMETWMSEHPGKSVDDYMRAKAAEGQAPQRPQQQLAIGPDGTVIELKPGVQVPQGTKTVSGDLGAKPTADEQRRADLAENLNENLDTLDEIVKRRPELFGPLSGRWAELRQKFGNDDPDLGTLKTIEHQIGMAQISAHGMRSAMGIEGAADSIMNNLHNGPKSILASTQAARNSIKTFTGDVERAKGGAGNAETKVYNGFNYSKGSDGQWHKGKPVTQ